MSEPVIDWKAICDQKSAELRVLYGQIAAMKQEMAQGQYELKKAHRRVKILEAKLVLLKFADESED